MSDLIRIREPRLEFALGQTVEDPRDGLALFGPYDANVYGVRAGVIGTKEGIRRFNKWVESIQRPVGIEYAERYRPPFPGFEAVFRIPWKPEPIMEVEIDPGEIDRRLSLDDRHIRIFETVDLFAAKLCEAKKSEESLPDLWFIVIPDKVHKLCTPRAFVPLASTRVVGVTIKHADDFRLYRRDGDLPVLRGLGLVKGEKHGFLATNGFIPRLQTYYGSEVPVPLSITINRGEADIQTVMADILALTKLNYNSCRHSDGLPVTLKFADAVGEILVSGPQKQQDPPLPFRHYI